MYVGIYERQKPRVIERLLEEFRKEKRDKRKQLTKKLKAERKRAYERFPEEVKEKLRHEGAARLMELYDQAYGSTTESGGASDTADERSASPTAGRPAAPFNDRGRKRSREYDGEEHGSTSSPRQIKRTRPTINFDGQVRDEIFDRSRTPSSLGIERVYSEDEVVESVETGEIGDKRANRSLLSEMSELRPKDGGLTTDYLEGPESYDDDFFEEDQYANGLLDDVDEEL